MGRKWFALTDLVGFFAERPHPVGLALHIHDIVDGLFRQANTCITGRFEIIKEVPNIAIDLNGGFRFTARSYSRHCLQFGAVSISRENTQPTVDGCRTLFDFVWTITHFVLLPRKDAPRTV